MTAPRASLLLLAAALTACTRPARLPSSSNLATSIAATLTSLPTSPASPTLPPSPTPPPSATASVTPSPVPSETPTIGPPPTATRPPLPTDDPRFHLDLSAPDYHDGFAQRFTWGELDDPGALNTWENGQMVAVDRLADPFVWWSATVPDAGASNFYAEITATIGDCRGRDAAGFGGRIGGANLDSGYTLELSCDGAYRVRRFSAGRVVVLRDWTNAEAILPGQNAVNRLGLMARGTKLFAFANGTRLGEPLEDASFAYGTFALYAMARETPGLTVTFDDFALWYVRN